jgi:hypothetical protein
MITNGALVPTDSYSLSIGSPDNTCGVEGHAIGDQRLILVDSADSDSQYNKIINATYDNLRTSTKEEKEPSRLDSQEGKDC